MSVGTAPHVRELDQVRLGAAAGHLLGRRGQQHVREGAAEDEGRAADPVPLGDVAHVPGAIGLADGRVVMPLSVAKRLSIAR
jgi:hypothetical protein